MITVTEQRIKMDFAYAKSFELFIYLYTTKSKRLPMVTSRHPRATPPARTKLLALLYVWQKNKNCVTAIYLVVIGPDDLNRFPLVHDLLIGGILQSDFQWAPPIGGFACNPGVYVSPRYTYTRIVIIFKT